MDTITRHPSLGPRMMQLAERCGVGYENEEIIHQICDRFSLHPSEPTWLDYVENLVQTVGRFGSVKETMQKSLKIMFEFLDFDSNRFNERAWSLFEKVLSLTDPSFVVPEWRTRFDWWPKYQRLRAKDGRKMSNMATKTRNDVLEALEELVL